MGNIGLPPSFGVPPPPTLSMPHLDVAPGEISMAVVTIDQVCPVSML